MSCVLEDAQKKCNLCMQIADLIDPRSGLWCVYIYIYICVCVCVPLLFVFIGYNPGINPSVLYLTSLLSQT